MTPSPALPPAVARRTIFAVTVQKCGEDARPVGFFSTRALAEAYATEGNIAAPLSYEVEEHTLDLPREELPGCWRAMVSDLIRFGEVVYWDDERLASCPPDVWGPLPHTIAHGYGATREAALASARAALASALDPTLPSAPRAGDETGTPGTTT